MLRAALTLGGTIAGLAALLSFKSHPAATVASGAPAPPAQAPSATDRLRSLSFYWLGAGGEGSCAWPFFLRYVP
jgi:hypothetical protein